MSWFVLTACSEGEVASPGCDHTTEAVLLFDAPFTAEGVYAFSISFDDVDGECSVELTADGKERLMCSPETWSLLSTTKSREVEGGGLGSAAEPDILGLVVGETDADEVTLKVTRDGVVVIDGTYDFETEKFEEPCGSYSRPRANVAVGDTSGSGGTRGALAGPNECRGLGEPECRATTNCHGVLGFAAGSNSLVYAGCRYSEKEEYQDCGDAISCGYPLQGDGPCIKLSTTCAPDGWFSRSMALCDLRPDCPDYVEGGATGSE